MTSRVSITNKEKKAKRKNSVEKKKTENKTVQRNRKQRRREPNPVYLHVQATP